MMSLLLGEAAAAVCVGALPPFLPFSPSVLPPSLRHVGLVWKKKKDDFPLETN